MAATDSRSLLEIAQGYSLPGTPVKVRLESIEPGLLMHSGESLRKQAEGEEEWRRNGGRGKFVPTSQQEAEWGAYQFEDKTLYLPADNLLRCLVEAGKAFKKPKSRASMTRDVAAGVRIDMKHGLGFPLKNPTSGRAYKKYEIDTRRAVIGKASIQRSRPHLPEWACDLEFLVDFEAVPDTIFAQIIGYAGSRIGLCDYRPELGGRFGCFSVTGLDVVGDSVPVEVE